MMDIRPDAVVLRCVCHGLPFAYIQDGLLIIQSRHHGEKCISVLPLVTVPMLRQKESAPYGNIDSH